jgi:hypothetical protein
MKYKGLAKGRIIELETPLPYCDGQEVSVSVEPFPLEQQLGSPLSILRVLKELPDIPIADVDEMEQWIKRGSLPVRLQGEFGENHPDSER